MLSILSVRLTIKVKVGIPESFKVERYPPPPKKKLGRVTLRYVQTDTKTPNIFGPTMLGIVASVLAVV